MKKQFIITWGEYGIQQQYQGNNTRLDTIAKQVAKNLKASGHKVWSVTLTKLTRTVRIWYTGPDGANAVVTINLELAKPTPLHLGGCLNLTKFIA